MRPPTQTDQAGVSAVKCCLLMPSPTFLSQASWVERELPSRRARLRKQWIISYHFREAWTMPPQAKVVPESPPSKFISWVDGLLPIKVQVYFRTVLLVHRELTGRQAGFRLRLGLILAFPSPGCVTWHGIPNLSECGCAPVHIEISINKSHILDMMDIKSLGHKTCWINTNCIPYIFFFWGQSLSFFILFF